MASPSDLPVDEPSTILFRPSKKRKIYRQRAQDNDNDDQATSQPAIALSPARDMTEGEQSLEDLIASSGAINTIEGDEVEGTAVSVAEILRLRKRNKRLGGVEFRVEGQRGREMEEQSLVLRGTSEEGQEEVVMGAPRRFAPQTGAVGDVNKHM